MTDIEVAVYPQMILRPTVYQSRVNGHWVVDALGGTAERPTQGIQHRQGFFHWADAVAQANDIAEDRWEQERARVASAIRAMRDEEI
jgi:hypothetical protein